MFESRSDSSTFLGGQLVCEAFPRNPLSETLLWPLSQLIERTPVPIILRLLPLRSYEDVPLGMTHVAERSADWPDRGGLAL